jgi:DUF1009 family protein
MAILAKKGIKKLAILAGAGHLPQHVVESEARDRLCRNRL